MNPRASATARHPGKRRVYKLADTLVYKALVPVPTVETAITQTIAMKASINPYSTIVAPSCAAANLRKAVRTLVIAFSPSSGRQQRSSGIAATARNRAVASACRSNAGDWPWTRCLRLEEAAVTWRKQWGGKKHHGTISPLYGEHFRVGHTVEIDIANHATGGRRKARKREPLWLNWKPGLALIPAQQKDPSPPWRASGAIHPKDRPASPIMGNLGGMRSSAMGCQFLGVDEPTRLRIIRWGSTRMINFSLLRGLMRSITPDSIMKLPLSSGREPIVQSKPGNVQKVCRVVRYQCQIVDQGCRGDHQIRGRH
jgi:hypothetical protein